MNFILKIEQYSPKIDGIIIIIFLRIPSLTSSLRNGEKSYYVNEIKQRNNDIKEAWTVLDVMINSEIIINMFPIVP